MDANNEQDDVLCEGLWPAELGYLLPPFVSCWSIRRIKRQHEGIYFRMCFNNSHSPRPMRLLRICPEEIMFLDLERWGGLSFWGAV